MTQQPPGDTVADERSMSTWVKVVLIVAAGIVVVFVGLGIWINSIMGGEETYLTGAGMVDEALVVANAPYTSEHLMNEVAVSLDECGISSATGSITNNSDATVEATVVVELTQSGVWVDSAMELVGPLPPGQTMTWHAPIFSDYDQCEADLFDVSGPQVDLLLGVSNRLQYCSLTFMLMDVASGYLTTETVVAEYLELARDPETVPEAFEDGIDPPCYLPDGRWNG